MIRSYPRPFVRVFGTALVALFATFSFGCGGAKGTITGQVKYQDKVLTSGQVTFYSDPDGKHVVSSGIKGGVYTIRDFPSGPVRITVQTFPPRKGASGEEVRKAVPKELWIVPPGGGQPEEPDVQTLVDAIPIPGQYRTQEKTPLRWTVPPGQKEYDIELQ
jgi:hypothetical protein